MHKIHRGFTLLELMVTIAIIGIVAMIALWDSTQLVENNRAENYLLELKRNISYARSQATINDEIVIVCPVSYQALKQKSSELKCKEAWDNENAIIIFIDTLTSKEEKENKNASYRSSEDALISLMEKISPNDKVIFTGNEKMLRFDTSGLIAYSPGDFIFCPNMDNKNNKALTVTKAGTAFYRGDTSESCI